MPSAEDEFSRRYGVTVAEAVDFLYRAGLYLTKGDRHETADLVNGFLEKLFRRPAPPEPVRDGRQYLRTLFVRHFIDELRRTRRARQELAPGVPDAPTSGPSPEQVVEHRQLWPEVEEVVGRDRARLLYLHFALGWTYVEISRTVRIPESTVGARIRERVVRLRTWLEGGDR